MAAGHALGVARGQCVGTGGVVHILFGERAGVIFFLGLRRRHVAEAAAAERASEEFCVCGEVRRAAWVKRWQWMRATLHHILCCFVISTPFASYRFSLTMDYRARLGLMTLGHDTLRNTLNGTAVCGEGGRVCVHAWADYIYLAFSSLLTSHFIALEFSQRFIP